MMGKNKNNNAKNMFDIKKNKAGCNLPNKKLEQILVDLSLHTSLNYVAKKNNCSWETVKRIEEDYKDEVDENREEKKKEFLDDIWDSARKALQIGNNKMNVTLEKSEKIDEIIDKFLDVADKQGYTKKETNQMLRKLTQLADYDLRDLSTYIGTLIDKHQLLNGGATDRIEGDISFSELAKRAEEYEEDE